MEIEAPYLEAIQSVAGKTPGEKQKTLNIIARKIARTQSSDGQKFDAEIPDVPKPLKPLIRVEVAKILHQYEVIVEALKSEDITIVNRALKASWFFDGSKSCSLVNAKYFSDHVFPEISLNTRIKVVKHLGLYLKNAAVAAEFFTALAQQYGVSQAVPLLVACDEDFSFGMITENKIVLSLRMVKTLYRKYPNLVIKYLMLSKPDDEDVRNLYRIDIRDYEDFLPEVANERFEDFMDIYRMHDGLNVKLGKKATRTFIKTRLNLLVDNPNKYLEKLVSLKIVTQELGAGDFGKMFKNLFPAKKDAFSYCALNRYLQFYEPEREKVPLIIDTFRQVYGEDLLNCKDLVDYDLMTVLSREERIKQARLKLEDDKDWHITDPERSWRCYLPTSESIPAITKEIAKSSDPSARGQLLKQLINTSKINDDRDALLKVLNYIYDRHRNDRKDIFYNCLSTICDSFDLATLSSNHWDILNKYIKWSELQDDLCDQTDTMSRVIGAGLHYCLLNNLPFDDYVRILVDMKIQLYHGSWNILTKYPELEKKFLNLFMEVIPKQYPFDDKIWKDKEANVSYSLAFSLWNFNKRIKLLNGKLKKLSVTDYPWLLAKIEVYILGKTEGSDKSKERFLRLIRENERSLYYVLIRNLDKFWDFNTGVIFDVLKEVPQRVLDNWKECLERVESTVHYEKHSLFIAKSRWYQLLPIKFYKQSLKTCNDPEKCIGSMVTLAILTEGKTYTKIIEPFIPDDKKLDVGHLEVKNTHNVLLAIATSLRKVNPPVSLEVIGRFCVGDYLQMGMRSLTSVCRRVPISKVIPFAKTLTNRPVSVMKHGIRLMYLVAPLEEIYTYLTDLWNLESHTSIRSVVFTKIYDLFCKQPDTRSWRMIMTCLDNLNTNDDKEMLKILPRLSTVPNEYLYEYIKSVLNAMKSMEQESEDPKLYVDISCQLIGNIDGLITRILPEEYCRDLIKEYLFVFDYNIDIFEAGLNLTVYSYLLSSKKYNEPRFQFFGDFFRNSVKEYWDRSHPNCFKFYPMNFMVRKFFDTISGIANDKHDVRVFESLLEIFQSVLKPHQDAVSYLNLVYSVAYHRSQTSVDFARILAEKIPELIETFSPECVISMSNRLSSFLRHRTFCESESKEEKLMAIIEVFLGDGGIHSAFFSANMLFDNKTKKLNQRHKTVVHALRNLNHPGVSWYLNERLATFEFRKDKDD